MEKQYVPVCCLLSVLQLLNFLLQLLAILLALLQRHVFNVSVLCEKRAHFTYGKATQEIHYGTCRVHAVQMLKHASKMEKLQKCSNSGNSGIFLVFNIVGDPDPNVFGPPRSGSGSISQRYGSGSFLFLI